MKQGLLLFTNTITLLGVLLVNYLSGTGALNGKSIGEVSEQYPTLVTPAAYAFSIWGLIYFLLILFVAYQWYGYFQNRHKDSLHKAGIWFSLSNIANGLWVVAWTSEAITWSVVLILLLLFFLVMLVLCLRLEIWDAPLRIIVFVWWPICFYCGWVILASVINIAVYLKSTAIMEGLWMPEGWSIATILLAGFVYAFLIYTRNMREAGLVGAWGLVAIAYARWPMYNSIVLTALMVALILLAYAGYHGIKNKETLPFSRIKKD